MIRSLYKDLIYWKNSANRKPLILQGARQVGKTWLMKDFGKQEFEKTVYLNFESSERLKSLFSVDFDIQRSDVNIYAARSTGPANLSNSNS